MRILLLNQFFYPDVAAVGQFMMDVAEGLLEEGHEVGVVCGSRHYEGVTLGETNRNLERVTVWRLPYYQGSTASSFRRIVSYLSFHIMALLRILTLQRFDVVFVFTTPPLVEVVAAFCRALKRSRVIAVAEDVYPDVAVALGFLPRNHAMTKALAKVSRWVLRKMDRVVTLSTGMAQHLVKKGVDANRITIIHNWADTHAIRPFDDEANRFSIEHGLNGKFVVQYSGHMGEAHPFETILQTALRFSSNEHVVFQFIGDGPRRAQIESFIREHKLESASLLPYQPRSRLHESLGSASICLISLAPDVADLMVPSKLYGILAAGKPVIFIGARDSEIARVVLAEECGFVMSHGDVDGLVTTIEHLRSSPALVRQLGENARKAATRSYDKRDQVSKYAALVSDVSGLTERTIDPNAGSGRKCGR